VVELVGLKVIEQETTRLPVRSALFKQDTGGLVGRWLTTSESPLLYVFTLEAIFLPIYVVQKRQKLYYRDKEQSTYKSPRG
jgi:hypothetical protein